MAGLRALRDGKMMLKFRPVDCDTTEPVAGPQPGAGARCPVLRAR